MQAITVPTLTLGGGTFKRKIREQLVQKFADFALAQLRKHGMTTANFKHRFMLRTGDSRREIAKLSRIIERNILKQTPYLAYSLRHESGLLTSSRGTMDFTFISYSRGDSLVRYANYINYLAIKNCVPLRLSVTEEASSNPPESRTITVSLRPAIWLPVGNLSDYETYDLWLENAKAVAEAAGLHSDAIYRSGMWFETDAPTLISHTPSYGISTTAAPSYAQRIMPERLFVFLPQLMKGMAAISRKCAYATEAYRIGAE